MTQHYVFRTGPDELIVDAEDGGRIVSFSRDGRELLTRARASPAYGSSFWPSPQRAWGWPPPAELDREPWQARLDGERLWLESRVNAALGLFARQCVSVDAETGVVTFVYELHNVKSEPIHVAPWQNTRVPPGGLTLFACETSPLPQSTLAIDRADGMAWFAHDPGRHGHDGKAFLSSSEGWLAHLRHNLALVKSFPRVSNEQAAPDESEVEIYVDGAGQFVEVEQQGPYEEIAPGAHSSWTVHWLLVDVPLAHRPTPEVVSSVRRALRQIRGEPEHFTRAHVARVQSARAVHPM